MAESNRKIQATSRGGRAVLLRLVDGRIKYGSIPAARHEFGSIETPRRDKGDSKLVPSRLRKSDDKHQKRCLSTAENEYFCVANQKDTAKSLNRSGIKRRFTLLLIKIACVIYSIVMSQRAR